MTHTVVRDNYRHENYSISSSSLERKKERRKTGEINERTLFHAVDSVIVGTTAKNRDNTCKTRAKEKESRSVRLALRVCLVSGGFEVEFPPPSRTLVSEGTPHTRVVWAKSARPVLAVCRVAVLGYVVKVAGLFVSLPRTRLSVFLSLSLSLHIMHVFLSLLLALSLPLSLSLSRSQAVSSSSRSLSSPLHHACFASSSSSASPHLSS